GLRAGLRLLILGLGLGGRVLGLGGLALVEQVGRGQPQPGRHGGGAAEAGQQPAPPRAAGGRNSHRRTPSDTWESVLPLPERLPVSSLKTRRRRLRIGRPRVSRTPEAP